MSEYSVETGFEWLISSHLISRNSFTTEHCRSFSADDKGGLIVRPFCSCVVNFASVSMLLEFLW